MSSVAHFVYVLSRVLPSSKISLYTNGKEQGRPVVVRQAGISLNKNVFAEIIQQPVFHHIRIGIRDNLF